MLLFPGMMLPVHLWFYFKHSLPNVISHCPRSTASRVLTDAGSLTAASWNSMYWLIQTQPLTLQLLIRDYANVKKADAHKHLTRIIKLEHHTAVETQPHWNTNPILLLSSFCFCRSCDFFFLLLSLFSSPSLFFFFFLRRVLLGTGEWQPMGGLSPLSLSASLTSTARSDAARLRRAVEVEQRATQAAVNGYIWLRRAHSHPRETIPS